MSCPYGATGAAPRTGRPSSVDRSVYSEGVQTVGIDRIVQKASVTKASLYNLFGSKEELVQAYLDARHRTAARTSHARVSSR